MTEIPEAIVVAMAEYPGETLIRCSCGALHPGGTPCPHAARDDPDALAAERGQRPHQNNEGYDIYV